MIEDEIERLNKEFKTKSKMIFEEYLLHPLRDGYITEDIELRHWYKTELKKLYEMNDKQTLS